MSTMSVRAGVIAFVTAFATMANAPTALGELPEHTLVAEFCCGLETPSPGDFIEFGFGEAVAIRNDVAFIGAPRWHDIGKVDVLNLTATGWKQVQTLTAPNPSAQSDFGRVLTFRDGVLVVGGGNAAYVFKRGTGSFTFKQTLRPPAADSVGGFPVALRYEGGTLLASASRSTAPSVVYVFERDSTGVLVRRAKVKASDGTAGDSFGASLSMTSRLFVVGSPGGAAYTFRRNSSGNWVQAQKLVPAVPVRGFGTSVAIDQGMILVGAPFVDMEGNWVSSGSPTPDGHVAGGAVFGFLPGVSGYIESFKLRPRPDERFEYEEFGSAIAMSGARIAITATGAIPNGDFLPDGLVFTYTRNGSSVLTRGITSRQALITAMALSSNALLIGAYSSTATCRWVCERVARIYDDNLFEP